MPEKDIKLLFLVSQPRSGSTLIQHIFGSRSDVATLPEPWFMLDFLYGLHHKELNAAYNAQFSVLALKDFLGRIPGGEDIYYQAIQSAANILYGAAATADGKPIFLDKTPRYYHIIPELQKTFPKAKIILLTRNPLAVFTSILTYNYHGDWFTMLNSTDRRQDLLCAPHSISKALSQNNQNVAHIQYEEFVRNPEATMRKLCNSLGIPFEADMLNYGKKVQFDNTSFVDKKSVYEHERPVEYYIDAWKNNLDSAEKVSIAGAYLDSLPDSVLDCYGFNRLELETELSKLDGYSSEKSRLWAAFLQTGHEEDLPFLEKAARKLIRRGQGVKKYLRERFVWLRSTPGGV